MAFAKILVIIGLLNNMPFVSAGTCEDWFKKSKINLGLNCLAKCASHTTGMNTFNCPLDCPNLCKEHVGTLALFRLTELYPSLNVSERALASKEPVKALEAYRLSWKSESLCKTMYRNSETNDESDACRHFIWAALLTKEFMRDFTEQVLYAHEQEPTQPEAEKAMDLANNQRGISIAESLVKLKTFSDEQIIESFKDQLKAKKLIVLKPNPEGMIK